MVDSLAPLTLNIDRVSDHDVLEKLRSIDELETRNPYRNRLSTQRYSERVRASMLNLPKQHHDIAILLFSDVLYVPARVLRSVWQNIWCELSDTSTGPIDINAFHLFTQDEDPLSSEFMRENRIEGRLDSDKYSRISTIAEFAHIILQKANKQVVDSNWDNDVRLLSKKPLWILLNDKVISGHSASTELVRIRQIADWMPTPPRVVLATQVIAERALNDLTHIIPRSDILFGIVIPEHMRINTEESPLWRGFRAEIEALTAWFSDQLIMQNPEIYGRMLKIDGNGMQFGYKNSGLLYADEVNCPTGTIPLLWHKCSKYVGPFPRIHSRLGATAQGAARQSDQTWKAIAELVSQNTFLEIF